MRNQTVLVRYSEIERDGASGTLIMRLAVAVNNCMSGQYLANESNKLKQNPRRKQLGYGLTLHLIAVQIGYLYEAMLILQNPNDTMEPTIELARASGDRLIFRLFDFLTPQGTAEYSSLMSLKSDPTEKAKFKKYVERFRNQAAFHYDAGYRGRQPNQRDKPLAKSALDRLARTNQTGRWTRYSVRGEPPQPGVERFNFADVVMDAAVCYEIWGIDGKHTGSALQAEADAIIDWIYAYVRYFVGFGSELCHLYFNSKLA